MYILSVIKTILSTFDPKTRKKYYALQLFFLLSAFFQVIGIASIGPFISILSNPGLIHSNQALSYAFEAFGFTSDLQFMFATAAGSLVMILLSNTIAALTIWLTFKFSVSLGSRLQQTAFRNFLYQDYLLHKIENYNRKIAVVAQQIPRFIYMLVQPFLMLTSQLFVASLILIGLLILDPLLAFLSAILIGGSYLVTYIYLRRKLAKHGARVSEKNERVQGILSESFIGIKDVKLDGLEQHYARDFNAINVRGLHSQAFIALSGDLPKFVIESISFGAILVLALVLLVTQDSISSVVPILSIYALAGYKLLPTMQQIYKSISSLSGHGSVADTVKKHVRHEEPSERNSSEAFGMPIKTVELTDASFYYPESKTAAVKNVSLRLEKGYIYSLVGHSGSGKSTLADIILGLLNLHGGTLCVNGEPLDSTNLRNFRQKLGYVAQNIFILDDTVTRNVAFGTPNDHIDHVRVERALKLANAWEFIETLPSGVESNLGQDGKLLSGGQRQRIGIARALYKETDLLVLDEPTSALDLESEYKLMKTLKDLKGNLIVLIISHRSTAIQMSDKILFMSRGELTGAGTYQEIIESNVNFENMMNMPHNQP